MIIHTKAGTSAERAEELSKGLKATSFQEGDKYVLVTSSSLKKVPSEFANDIKYSFLFSNILFFCS